LRSQPLAYPERAGLGGSNPPLNLQTIFLILYVCKKHCPSSAPAHQILTFIQENVKNCTPTPISHLASASGDFVPQTAYRGYAPQLDWGTSSPILPLCKILGTPVIAANAMYVRVIDISKYLLLN